MHASRPIRTVALLAALSLPALCQGGEEDRVQYFRAMDIEKTKPVLDALCIGCPVRVVGTVKGDVIAIGGDVEISGTVEGDAVAVGGRIRVADGAEVRGDATAIGGNVVASSNAKVAGAREATPYCHIPGQRSLHPLGVVSFLAGNTLLALLGGLLLGSRRSENIAATIRSHPVWAILAGLLLFFLWVWLLKILFVKAWWQKALVWCGHLVTMVLCLAGYTGTVWLCGGLTRARRPTARRAAGAAMITLAMLIPVAGMFLFLAILVMSFGAGLVSRAGGAGRLPDWIRRKAPEPEANIG